MTIYIIFVAIILFLCILADKFSGRFGLPALILFMGIGMLFGCDGLFKIQFSNYTVAEEICTVALSFIMFYGGFNTKWSTAKAIASKAIFLSTFGVLITAFLTGLFAYYVLDFSLAESFLIGSVLSSTDAASVFSILRKKKLNLKYQTAPILEIESGSNDPASYMLTIIGITLLNSNGLSKIPSLLFSQLIFGILIGVGTSIFAIYILSKTNFVSKNFYAVFIIGIIAFTLGISLLVNGNGFLSVYLLGIILGNAKIENKKILIHFFDGITGLAQMLIFFLLGLLSFPHNFPQIVVPALLIALFITLIARPIAVFAVLKPFKCKLNQCMLISFAGLRGAASIVFSIMVVANSRDISFDIFHIVFMVALFSVTIQGSLLPLVANKLNMVDNREDVRKTFNDYQEESSITLMRFFIPEGHNWIGKKISDVHMPTNSLAIMIKRAGDTIVPNGDTVICVQDSVILSVPSYEPSGNENLKEILITNSNKWSNKKIKTLNLPNNVLIALIKRGSENLIPDGETMLLPGDKIVLFK